MGFPWAQVQASQIMGVWTTSTISWSPDVPNSLSSSVVENIQPFQTPVPEWTAPNPR